MKTTIRPGATEHQAQGNAIRAEARSRFEAIRADTNLSPQGKVNALAKEWIDAEAALSAVRSVAAAADQQRLEALRTTLFGGTSFNSGEAIGFRDAHMRAQQLSNEGEAVDLLGVARLTGDTVLARAIALASFQNNWTRALSDFAAGDSKIEAAINELFALDAAAGSPRAVASRLAGQMSMTISKPAEITHLGQVELRAIAEGV